jgi:hypothetical protein
MKFIETLCGQIVNIDEIAYLEHECSEKGDHYYSYVYLKNGKQLDLLDTVDTFDDDNHFMHRISGEHIIHMHKILAQKLCMGDFDILGNGELEEYIWEQFMKSFKRNTAVDK